MAAIHRIVATTALFHLYSLTTFLLCWNGTMVRHLCRSPKRVATGIDKAHQLRPDLVVLDLEDSHQ